MTCTRVLSLACFSLLLAPFALAQQPPAPQDGGGPQQHQMDRRSDRGMRDGGGPGDMHGGGMGIVPPGTWWRSPDVITKLTLTADQQKHLDEIFLQSRIQLLHLKASLEEEQLKLEPVLNANPPDASKALAQISHIADLRADLEKANAKMLLGLRGVLTADQWTKLHSHDRSMGRDGARDRKDGGREQRGPGATGGPGAAGGPGPMSMESPDGLLNPPVPEAQAQ